MALEVLQRGQALFEFFLRLQLHLYLGGSEIVAQDLRGYRRLGRRYLAFYNLLAQLSEPILDLHQFRPCILRFSRFRSVLFALLCPSGVVPKAVVFRIFNDALATLATTRYCSALLHLPPTPHGCDASFAVRPHTHVLS